MRWSVLLLAGFLCACSSTRIPKVPTPEQPDVVCIAESPFGEINPRTGGKVLPQIARSIGYTPGEDGEREKIVFGVYNRTACVEDINGPACGWLPIAREKVFRGAVCGSERGAYLEVDRAAERIP